MSERKIIAREITPTLTAELQTTGDVLFDVTTIKDVFSFSDETTSKVPGVILRAITIVDDDDQAVYDMDLYFSYADVSPAAAGAAFVGLSDADSLKIVGHVFIDGSAEAKDLTNNKVYFQNGLSVYMTGAVSSRDLFVFGVVTGAPTTTAAGLKFRFVFEQDD